MGRPCLRFKPALNSKGLRPDLMVSFTTMPSLQASPEFKGIKTPHRSVEPMRHVPLQASPEFKGIKTLEQLKQAGMHGFKPALNSKGLRHGAINRFACSISFKPALNSKGLRRHGGL